MSLALQTHKHTWYEMHATSEFTATTKGHTNKFQFQLYKSMRDTNRIQTTCSSNSLAIYWDYNVTISALAAMTISPDVIVLCS